MRVFNTYEERLSSDPALEGVDEIEAIYSLIPATDPQVGEPLVHVVRNQANLRTAKGNKVRIKQHPCNVVALLPSYVRVRFAAGKEKNVRPNSLYRIKE
jgi:hypothetical protein